MKKTTKRKFRSRTLLMMLAVVAESVATLVPCETRAQLPTGWSSVRALGMGNAQTAVASDADAILYNPAMLMKSSGVHWTVMNPRAGIDNPTNLQLLSALGNTGGNVAESVNALYGKNIWAGGGAMSAVTVPYLGVAAYANTEAGILAANPVNTRLNTNYYFDYGGAVAVAIPVIPSFAALGMTIRTVNRTGTTAAIGPGTLGRGDMSALTDEFKRRGNATAVDFGTIVTIPGPLSPTLSLVYRDVGYTTFSHIEGSGSPPRVEPEMIVGASMALSVPLITITPAIDYRYVGKAGVATGNNLGLGVEIDLPLIFVRGGLSQGYYTAGLGLDLGLIRADVATWGVELGAYPGQMVDRRYMVQLTIDLGLDFGFFSGWGGGGGSGGGGKGGSERQRLKQRR